MNLCDIYNDDISVLLSAKKQLEDKIFQKEISILKSKEYEPVIIEWLKNNLERALLYIPHVKDMSDLGLDEDDYHPIYWDKEYMQRIFPEQERIDFFEHVMEEHYPWDICLISIPICKLNDKNHYIDLTYDTTEYEEGYQYSVSYSIKAEYVFFADILERLLLENKEEIYQTFHSYNFCRF